MRFGQFAPADEPAPFADRGQIFSDFFSASAIRGLNLAS
jgi:hypothetical protein